VATQLMRNSMVDVLDKAYIRTARAKGVPEYKVLMKHALINAMVPMLGALTGWVASLMAGAMFVEYVFGFKGIGTLLLKAIEHQDFPVVMGVTLLIVTVYIVSDEFIKMFLKKFNPSMQRA
jgi:peptide/nickel transport system permease protein